MEISVIITSYILYAASAKLRSNQMESQQYQFTYETKPKKWHVILKAIIIPVIAVLAWYVLNYVVQFAAAYIFASLTAARNPGADIDELAQKFYEMYDRNVSLLYIIFAALFILLFILLQKMTHFTRTIDISTRKLGVKSGITAFAIGTFVGVFFNIFIAILSQYLPQSWVDGNAESVGAFDGGSQALMIIATVICAPIVEEIIFRGCMYNAIKKIITTVPRTVTRRVHIAAIIVSTVITSTAFGVFHGNILQAIYAGVLSLFMIWIYEQTGSLISNVLFHAAFNFSGFATAYMAEYLGYIIALLVSAMLTVVLMMAEHSYCQRKNSFVYEDVK